MDIYTYLKQDHAKVAELFEKILAAHLQKNKNNFFTELQTELLLHAETEHKTFYNALKNSPELKDKIAHADKEHSEIKEYLDLLNNISPESDKWLVKIGELKHSVEHHVEEEENEIFPQAKKILSSEEANELAITMDQLKQKIKKAFSSS